MVKIPAAVSQIEIIPYRGSQWVVDVTETFSVVILDYFSELYQFNLSRRWTIGGGVTPSLKMIEEPRSPLPKMKDRGRIFSEFCQRRCAQLRLVTVWSVSAFTEEDAVGSAQSKYSRIRLRPELKKEASAGDGDPECVAGACPKTGQP